MEETEKIECPDCGLSLQRPVEGGEFTCNCGAVLISEEQEYAELALAEELSRKWYYAIEKQRYGPVPWNRIKEFIRREKLGPDDLIWSRGMENWQKVRSFTDLIDCFPEDRRPKHEEHMPRAIHASTPETGLTVAKETVPVHYEDSAGKKMTDDSGTFLIQVSAGLLASLAFFQLIAVAVVIYASVIGMIGAVRATWLIAALIVGSILAAGLSQLIRLLCASTRKILDHQRKTACENSVADEVK